MMNDTKIDYDHRIIDKYQESLNIYWSALLTINGLLMTFFSVDILSSHENVAFLNYVLVGSCMVSIWLLIWNFRTIKTNYYQLGRMNIDDMPDVPEEIQERAETPDDMRRVVDEYTRDWRANNLKNAAARKEWMMSRESIIEMLLIVETVIIAIIIST